MVMRRYEVRFYYGTDLRYQWLGEASNEVGALVKGLEAFKENAWVDLGFRVEIVQPDDQAWAGT